MPPLFSSKVVYLKGSVTEGGEQTEKERRTECIEAALLFTGSCPTRPQQPELGKAGDGHCSHISCPSSGEPSAWASLHCPPSWKRSGLELSAPIQDNSVICGDIISCTTMPAFSRSYLDPLKTTQTLSSAQLYLSANYTHTYTPHIWHFKFYFFLHLMLIN